MLLHASQSVDSLGVTPGAFVAGIAAVAWPCSVFACPSRFAGALPTAATALPPASNSRAARGRHGRGHRGRAWWGPDRWWTRSRGRGGWGIGGAAAAEGPCRPVVCCQWLVTDHQAQVFELAGVWAARSQLASKRPVCHI